MDYLNEFIRCGRLMKANSSVRDAEELKGQGFAFIFNMLCDAYVNRFKWEYSGADQTIATDLIESTILFSETVAFHKLNGTSWFNFQPTGVINDSFYGKASTCELIDYFGRTYGRHLVYQESDIKNIADTVLIYDNVRRVPAMQKVMFFTRRLGEINTAINATLSNILGINIFAGTREQVKVIKDLIKKGKNGLSYAVVEYDEANPSSFRPQLITSPEMKDVLVTLYEAWDKTYADFLQSIGVRANTEINKKSGVTPIELTENRQNTDLVLNAAYECRLRGIEHAERIGLYGLSVSLSNFEPRTSAMATEAISDAGGSTDEVNFLY